MQMMCLLFMTIHDQTMHNCTYKIITLLRNVLATHILFILGPIRVIIIVVTIAVLVTLPVMITGATVVVFIIRHRKKKGITCTISYFYI